MTRRRVCLVVGHKATSRGASIVDGTSSEVVEVDSETRLELEREAPVVLTEWDFNLQVMAVVAELAFESPYVELVPVFRRTWGTLPADVDAWSPAFSVSLHLNASESHKGHGAEALHYRGSKRSAALGRTMLDEVLGEFPELRDRGLLPVDSEGRGARLLRKTAGPIVILEPFFLDNDRDQQAIGVSDWREPDDVRRVVRRLGRAVFKGLVRAATEGGLGPL